MKEHAPGGIREVFKIALPMVIGNSAYTIMQFCDRIFLARYDDIAIQAAMPAGLLSFSLICLFLATAGYSGTFVAQFHGAKEPDNCVKATVHGLLLILACSPIFLAMIPLGYLVFEVFGHAADLIEQERIYLRWMLYGALPTGMGWVLSGFFTGRGKVRLATAAGVTGCAVNIVLDWAMIFGRLGLPEMGLRGAAIATFISSWVAPAILFVSMLRSGPVRTIRRSRVFVFNPEFLRRLIRFGLPSGIQVFLDVGAFSIFVLMTAQLEPATLTVTNIVFSINNLAFSPLMGFGAAASILSGQYHGAGENAHAMKSGWASLKLGCMYMAFIGSVFVFLPETLISLFPSENSSAAADPAFLRTGRHLLYVMTAWGFLDTANIVLMGSLKGVGDTKFVMFYISMLAWFLWLPGEVLIFRYGGGVLAAWLWMGFYIAVAAFGFMLRWHRGKWQKIDMVHAAGIWTTAAIGLAVGCGMYISAIAATVLVLIGLELFMHISDSIRHQKREMNVVFLADNVAARDAVLDAFNGQGKSVVAYSSEHSGGKVRVNVDLEIPEKDAKAGKLLEFLKTMNGIETESIR